MEINLVALAQGKSRKPEQKLADESPKKAFTGAMMMMKSRKKTATTRLLYMNSENCVTSLDENLACTGYDFILSRSVISSVYSMIIITNINYSFIFNAKNSK